MNICFSITLNSRTLELKFKISTQKSSHFENESSHAALVKHRTKNNEKFTSLLDKKLPTLRNEQASIELNADKNLHSRTDCNISWTCAECHTFNSCENEFYCEVCECRRPSSFANKLLMKTPICPRFNQGESPGRGLCDMTLHNLDTTVAKKKLIDSPDWSVPETDSEDDDDFNSKETGNSKTNVFYTGDTGEQDSEYQIISDESHDDKIVGDCDVILIDDYDDEITDDYSKNRDDKDHHSKESVEDEETPYFKDIQAVSEYFCVDKNNYIGGKNSQDFGNVKSSALSWLCLRCEYVNEPTEVICEKCLTSRYPNPLDTTNRDATCSEEKPDTSVSDDNITYSSFKYRCSLNTNRVHLYDENEMPLKVNFKPLCVEHLRWSDLPDLLSLNPINFANVSRFVSKWNSLSLTKQRVVARAGNIFSDPCTEYERVKKERKCAPTTKRFMAKDEMKEKAVSVASCIGGEVRTVFKPSSRYLKKNHHSPEKNTLSKFNSKYDSLSISTMQDKSGVPIVVTSAGMLLCLMCQKVTSFRIDTDVSDSAIELEWAARFCSENCAHDYWMKTHGGYARKQLYLIEHGVCQCCQIDAQSLFIQIKSCESIEARAKMINDSSFSTLSKTQKINIVKNPSEGLFWQMDHIRPVFEGGGQCDIDNLRTLCTVCHLKETRLQAARRARNRIATKSMSIVNYLRQ